MEPQLRERTPEFRAPAVLVARDRGVPDRVPARILVRVVVPVDVALHAGGIDPELERGAPIVERIDNDAHPVGRRLRVAPGANPDDLLRLRIERVHRDVQRVGIVGDARFGLKGGFAVIARLTLPEAGNRRNALPDRVVQFAVDADRRSFRNWSGGDPVPRRSRRSH